MLSDTFSEVRHAVHKITVIQRRLMGSATTGGVLRALAALNFVKKPNPSLL